MTRRFYESKKYKYNRRLPSVYTRTNSASIS
nr:MAG TPA: hypothetical protein [Caudoviricetes sp.]